MKKIVFLTVVFLVACTNSFACDCVEELYPYTAPLEEKVKIAWNRTDAIFSGKVLAISIGRQKSGDMKGKFRIDNIWKGELPSIITIVTPANSGLCGYGFKKGKLYLVYASERDRNKFGTTNCSRTQQVANAKEELKILGQRKKPKKKLLTSTN